MFFSNIAFHFLLGMVIASTSFDGGVNALGKQTAPIAAQDQLIRSSPDFLGSMESQSVSCCFWQYVTGVVVWPDGMVQKK
jgi:hypothetical protein